MEVEYELKTLLRRNDLTQKYVADKLKKPYSTIGSWLNGFSPLPPEYRSRIMALIEERKTVNADGERM